MVSYNGIMISFLLIFAFIITSNNKVYAGNISSADAIAIAINHVKERGGDHTRFQDIRAKRNGAEWNVSFSKVPAKPGGTFFVVVNARSGEIVRIIGGR